MFENPIGNTPCKQGRINHVTAEVYRGTGLAINRLKMKFESMPTGKPATPCQAVTNSDSPDGYGAIPNHTGVYGLVCRITHVKKL